MCMDERSERVQRFKIELKNNDLRTEIVQYPKVMMRMMDEFCMPSTTTEFRADKTRYQSKVYMTAGQSADARLAAASSHSPMRRLHGLLALAEERYFMRNLAGRLQAAWRPAWQRQVRAAEDQRQARHH